MKTLIKILFVFFLSIFLIRCAQINYVGKTYTPTSQIDVYYSEAEIEKEYTTIGHATGSGGFMLSNEQIQEKLIQKARAVGADGVIIKEVEKTKVVVNDSTEEERHIKATFIKYK